MAFDIGDIARLKFETGYNVAQVGAELYVLNGYAAVFDAAIAPYLIDQGTTSTTTVPVVTQPTNAAITLAANPAVKGAVVNVYGQLFGVGSRVVVDVGPNQEAGVIIQALTGLVATVQLALPHGPTVYPVLIQGGEFLVRDVLARLDVIGAQIKGFAPITAGLAKADGGESEFYASRKGGRTGGQKDTFDALMFQRDMARRDLCALLGIENLWEKRGRYGAGAGAQTYGRY